MVGALTDQRDALASGLRNYLRNSGWLLAEYVLRAVIGLLVGIQVARHLGPHSFGSLSYALALVALIAPVARLGLDAIAIKRLVSDPEGGTLLLGTVFRLKLLAAATSITVIVLLGPWLSPEPVERLCLVVIVAGLLFQATDVMDFFYQARFLAARASLCRMIALVLSALLKLILIWQGAGLVAFALAALADQVLLAMAYAIAHAWGREGVLPGLFDQELVRPLLVEARPLLIAGLAVAAYTRIDQIVLRNLLGAREAGLYVAATNLSESAYFLPLLFAGVAFPLIVAVQQNHAAEYARYRRLLYRRLLLGSALIAALGSAFAPIIVPFLYGPEFIAATEVFAIHVWSLVFVAYSAAFTRILIAQGRQSLILRLTLIGLAANLAGIWLLISLWGLAGAAWAVLLAHAAIASALLVLHPPARADLLDALQFRRSGAAS